MKPRDSALAYHQSSALGATPIGQVVALYDTILRDLHRAISAVQSGQIEPRVTAVNHALLVIGELQGVLDFERGGEPARNLNDFYNVVRSMILKASIAQSRELFEQALTMITRIRSAWSRIENSPAASLPTNERSKPAAGNRQLTQTPRVPADDVAAFPRGWSA